MPQQRRGGEWVEWGVSWWGCDEGLLVNNMLMGMALMKRFLPKPKFRRRGAKLVNFMQRTDNDRQDNCHARGRGKSFCLSVCRTVTQFRCDLHIPFLHCAIKIKAQNYAVPDDIVLGVEAKSKCLKEASNRRWQVIRLALAHGHAPTCRCQAHLPPNGNNINYANKRPKGVHCSVAAAKSSRPTWHLIIKLSIRHSSPSPVQAVKRSRCALFMRSPGGLVVQAGRRQSTLRTQFLCVSVQSVCGDSCCLWSLFAYFKCAPCRSFQYSSARPFVVVVSIVLVQAASSCFSYCPLCLATLATGGKLFN